MPAPTGVEVVCAAGSGSIRHAVDGDPDGDAVDALAGFAVAGGVAADGVGNPVDVVGDDGLALEGQPAAAVDLAEGHSAPVPMLATRRAGWKVMLRASLVAGS